MKIECMGSKFEIKRLVDELDWSSEEILEIDDGYVLMEVDEVDFEFISMEYSALNISVLEDDREV